MIVRKLYVTSTMNCCRKSEVIYKPASKIDVLTENELTFMTTLGQWKKDKLSEFCSQLKDMAMAECAALGTDSYLCNWQCNETDVKEEVLKMDKEKVKAIQEFEDRLLQKEIDILKLEVEIQKKELELMKRQLLRLKEAE